MRNNILTHKIILTIIITLVMFSGCTKIDTMIRNREGNTFSATITTKRPADAMCTMTIVPFTEVISLDVYGLEAGDYEVNVNGVRTWAGEKRFMLYPKSDPIFVPFYCKIQMLLFS
jgi:uncharacterized protein YceK